MSGGPSEEERNREAQRQRDLADQQRARADERAQQLLEEERAQREQDLARGRERGQELFGEGSLGTRNQETITSDIADVMAKRKAALAGLTPEQQTALQEQALGGIGRDTETQLRRLRGIQAAQGLRGGTAAAQQAGILQQGQQAAGDVQRDIFLQNIGRQDQALNALEQSLLGEQQRSAQEKFGQLGTEFGFAGLGAAERGGARQQVLGELLGEEAAAQSALNQGKK